MLSVQEMEKANSPTQWTSHWAAPSAEAPPEAGVGRFLLSDAFPGENRSVRVRWGEAPVLLKAAVTSRWILLCEQWENYTPDFPAERIPLCVISIPPLSPRPGRLRGSFLEPTLRPWGLGEVSFPFTVLFTGVLMFDYTELRGLRCPLMKQGSRSHMWKRWLKLPSYFHLNFIYSDYNETWCLDANWLYIFILD